MSDTPRSERVFGLSIDEAHRLCMTLERELAAKSAEVERLRETLTGIRDADWREWEDMAAPEEFVTWAKNRARAALEPTP